MRIAVVVQRYGDAIVGGAESQARLVVGQLSRRLPCEIDVLTTTATSHATWANALAAGVEDAGDGVRILRFDSRCRRLATFDAFNRLAVQAFPAARAVRALGPVVDACERLWFLQQGPVVPRLVRYLAAQRHRYDRVIFFTYLYYPTIWGMRVVPEKSILVPEAHDEPPFHFATVVKMLRTARVILVNSEPERHLVLSKAPGRDRDIRLAGVGIDEHLAETPLLRERAPYFLYVGRMSRAKGVQELIDGFLAFSRTWTSGRCRLLLAGSLESDVVMPDSPLVENLGFVSESLKRELIEHATGVVTLSQFESLSMIVVEAMAMGTPVIVNGHCPVLRHYAESTETALAVYDREGLTNGLRQFAETDWTSPAALTRLRAAQTWVGGRYSWKRVIAAYREALAV